MDNVSASTILAGALSLAAILAFIVWIALMWGA